MAEPLADAGIFTDLQERLYRNVCRASGVEPYTETKRPLTLPYESDLPTEELIDAYLGDTPFVDLLATRVPFVIPLEARLSHSWIIGQPGTGKSTLLQHLITNDFLDVYHDEKCVVVMESNRDLIKAIEGSAVFAPGEPLEGKLLSIDLEDVEWPIALNLFDIGLDQIEANADPKHRRALLTSVLFLYDYIFGGLLGAELTSRQNTLFTFTIQLLLHIPGATLDTLIDLMQPKGLLAFQEHLSKLSRDAQRFFELKFNSTEFSRTKDQVVDRLFAVKRITTLSEMFASPKTKLDFYTEMGKAQVILINAPLSLLQADGVEIVGRFFIAMILLAAQKRQLLPQAKRLPCMIYIDECQDFIWRDTMIPDILDQARKLKVSLTLAHQRLNQLENYVLDALYGSTAVKFASQISDAGAHALARDMRTTPEFILNQPPFHFAAYVRGLTSNAVSIGIPRMDLTRAQRMTSEQAAAIRDEMRSRYSVHFSKVGVLPEPEPEPPPPPTVPSPPPAVPPSSALVEPAQAEEAGAVETEKKKRWPLS